MKKFVQGYYVLKSGTPCVLDLKLDTYGALVPSGDGSVSVFLRHDEISLWGIKTRVQRAIDRSKRVGGRISSAEHLSWAPAVKALFRPGEYTIVPCRNPAAIDQLAKYDAQQRSTIHEQGFLTMPLEFAVKPEKKKTKKGQMLLAPQPSAAEAVISDL